MDKVKPHMVHEGYGKLVLIQCDLPMFVNHINILQHPEGVQTYQHAHISSSGHLGWYLTN